MSPLKITSQEDHTTIIFSYTVEATKSERLNKHLESKSKSDTELTTFILEIIITALV